MELNSIICPEDSEKMAINMFFKKTIFRGEEITYPVEVYVCERCGLEIGTIEQTAKVQNAITEAYRKKVGLLTGQEIREHRKKLGLSQNDLASKAGVGLASIKRWENGVIQTRSMNCALKSAFQGIKIGNLYNGNRSLSIPRIKLVMKEFEVELGIQFRAKNDMMLFDAKYLWYADMLAYKKLGKSLTGATYAALSFGPQLNNYKDLVDEIRDADETKAEPLTADEKKIITRVAVTFPTEKIIFDAAHREEIWKKKSPGVLIPYSDSAKLAEIEI
jgi:putative zinc finger/helix-turn-helix YgiT family protein